MRFFNDKNKNLKWWNRNYLYIGTIIVIAVNILLFWRCGDSWETEKVVLDGMWHWTDRFYFEPTKLTFLNAFSHSNWQHVLLNMLSFTLCGIYLERKMGTFGILGLVAFGAYVSGVAITANDLSVFWHGFSGVNYFLYAYVLFDYVFSFSKHKRNTTNIILGAIVLAFIYVAMCFNGGVEAIKFEIYPHDLMYNCAHYCGLSY